MPVNCPWCGRQCKSSPALRTHALMSKEDTHPDSKEEIHEVIDQISTKSKSVVIKRLRTDEKEVVTVPEKEKIEKSLSEELTGRLGFDGVRKLRELADEHEIPLIECIVEILRRAMKTRKETLADLEDGEVESLRGIYESLCLGGDQGEVSEFLLNLTFDEIEANINKFWEAQEEAEKAKGEKDERRKSRERTREKGEDEEVVTVPEWEKTEKGVMEKLIEEMEEDTSVDEKVRLPKEWLEDEEMVESPWEDTPAEEKTESDWEEDIEILEKRLKTAQADLKEADELKTAKADELKMAKADLKEADELKTAQADELKTAQADFKVQAADLKELKTLASTRASENRTLQEKVEASRSALRVRKTNAAIDAKVEEDNLRGYPVKSLEDYLEEFDWC